MIQKRLIRRRGIQNEKEKFNYFYSHPGSMPGTLRIEEDAPAPEIVLIDYSPSEAVRVANITPEDCAAYLKTDSVAWVDVAGLGSEAALQRLGQVFKLHPLVLEDVVNVPQRPKIEDYQEQLIIVTQMAVPKEGGGFWLEQVSFVLGNRYLLTVQEEPERDCFEPVRDRLRYNKGLIRQKGADYLAYALWDAIIDGYFPILESYGERLEALEDEVVLNPTEPTLGKIYQIRRELLALRRAIWPQRDTLNSLLRDEHPLMEADIRPYLRDCYDHVVQIIDVIETYRELAAGLMDVYLSAASNRMNEVMKLLTVISTIFIPLTFIAGVYGMNFEYMPELDWRWGYPVCWAVMIGIAASLVYYFWRRGWLSSTSTFKPH